MSTIRTDFGYDGNNGNAPTREWVSVTDRMPEENQLVDAWLDRGHRAADVFFDWNIAASGHQYPLWHYRNGHHVWRQFGDQDITHWMPLPEPPDDVV